MALIQDAGETTLLMSPLELCPPEVWYNEIFPKLHVDDKIALHNTCTLFRDLFEGLKLTWMLPAVLPNFYKYLDKEAALTIRRVSKKWSNSLDEHLDSLYRNEFTYYNEESKSFKPVQPHIAEARIDRSRLEDGYVLQDITDVRALLRKLGNVEHPTKSLPGGKLVTSLRYESWFDGDEDEINDNNDDIPGRVLELLSGLVAILEAVGRSIRYLNLRLFVNLDKLTPVSAWFYRQVFKCLLEVPNLRFLKFSSEISYDDIYVNRADQFPEIVEAMNKYPLPLIPRLEYFEPTRFEENRIRQPIFMDYLFELLVKGRVMWNWVHFRKYPPVYIPPQASLSTLKEMAYYDIEYVGSISRFAAPNLTTLRLLLGDSSVVRYSPWLGSVDAARLMQCIHNLFPALEKLSIECFGRPGFKLLSPLPVTITFPSVKTLRLVASGEISYDFLRCFPSLERFNVVNNLLALSPHQQLPITEAQYKAASWFDFRQLERSQAWVVLPNLKFISFKLVKHYDADDHSDDEDEGEDVDEDEDEVDVNNQDIPALQMRECRRYLFERERINMANEEE